MYTKAFFLAEIAKASKGNHVLNFSKKGITDADLVNLESAFTNTDDIRELILGSNSITDVGAKTIAEIMKKNPNIKTVLLPSNKINNKGTFYLFEALPLSSVKFLSLAGNDIKAGSATGYLWSKIFAPLADSRCCLRNLVLTDTQCAAILVDLAAYLGPDGPLDNLYLANNKITDNDLDNFLKTPVFLNALNLEGNQITDTGFMNYLFVRALKTGNIYTVRVSFNLLTDVSCTALYANAHSISPDIEEIEMMRTTSDASLTSNIITSSGLDNLSGVIDTNRNINCRFIQIPLHKISGGFSNVSRGRYFMAIGNREIRNNSLIRALSAYKKASPLLVTDNYLTAKNNWHIDTATKMKANSPDVSKVSSCTDVVISELDLHHDCAAMCQKAYKKDSTAQVNYWSTIATSDATLVSAQDVNAIKKTNYYGIAFCNEKLKIVVFAHRGTVMDVKGSLVQDISILSSTPPSSMNLAKKFSDKIMSNYAGYGELHTGHSLGAILAELMAYLRNAKAITFESPGSKEMITKLIEYNKESLLEQTQRLNSAILTLVNNPNIINTCQSHFGIMVKLSPLIVRGPKETVSKLQTILTTCKFFWNNDPWTAVFNIVTAAQLYSLYRGLEPSVPPALKGAFQDLCDIFIQDASSHAMDLLADVLHTERVTQVLARRYLVKNWTLGFAQYLNLATYLNDFDVNLEDQNQMSDMYLKPDFYGYAAEILTNYEMILIVNSTKKDFKALFTMGLFKPATPAPGSTTTGIASVSPLCTVM